MSMSILACMVVEKSLPKKSILQIKEGKKIGKIEKNKQENAGSKCLNTSCVINLHTKYEHFSLHGCGEIFDKNVTKKGTNGRTDGQM